MKKTKINCFSFDTIETFNNGNKIEKIVKTHKYPTAREATKARNAFIAHTRCRDGAKNKTITYQTFDYKTEKLKKVTVSIPKYKVGTLENN